MSLRSITAAYRLIVEVHRGIERWLAEPYPDEACLAPLDACLHPRFQAVTAEGARHDRASYLAALRAARGLRGEDFRLDIVDAKTIADRGDTLVMGYDEIHRVPGARSRRRVTAIFAVAEGSPEPGLQWLALHETWVPEHPS